MSEHEAGLKRRIIESVFNKRNAASEGPQESYAAHLKIWEIEGNHEKPRFIILARASNGSSLVHKSRQNPNGTFSVGKTWKLSDLRAVDLEADSLEINVSFARNYVWQSESQRDRECFVNALVSLFRESMGPNAPLRITGLAASTSRPDRYGPQSTRSAVNIEHKSGSQVSEPHREHTLLPIPASLRPGGTGANGRSASPSGSTRSGRTMSPAPTSPPKVPLVASASQIPPGNRDRPRRLSNATTSSIRSHDSYRSSQAPSNLSSLPAMRVKETKEVSASHPMLGQVQKMAIPSQESLPLSTTQSNDFHDTSMRPSLSLHSNGSEIEPYVASPMSALAPSDTLAPSSAIRLRNDSTTKGTVRTASPVRPSMSKLSSSQVSLENSQSTNRRDPNARISFFDPMNQVLIDRLLFSTNTDAYAAMAKIDMASGTASDDEHDGVYSAWEEEGDTAAATLANIEEMLEGYEWAGDDLPMGLKRGPTEHIESRLLDELVLLEKANVYSLLESGDDRVAKVLKGLDEAIEELDNMETTISSYKIHLNAVSDDIVHIQSQNRGLQVQIQNQQQLLSELEKLLQTVNVARSSLAILMQESLEPDEGIMCLEEAATELYKALLAGLDNDMAATIERLEEYRTHNSQFCKRIFDFLSIVFTSQVEMLLGETNGLGVTGDKDYPFLFNHQAFEEYLGRYCGLMLYMKEMDENRYAKICAAYFSAASELHSKQIKAFLSSYSGFIQQAAEEEAELSFSPTAGKDNSLAGGLRRAGTVVRNPLDSKKEKDKGKTSGGPSEAVFPSTTVIDVVLEQIAPQVYNERMFIADFLLINDNAITFADYVSLDHIFRRQAARYAQLGNSTMKLVRGAMDLIFGFLPTEFKSFLDTALAKDRIQIAGVIAIIEKAIADAESRGNYFYSSVLEKQHQRLKTTFERYIDEQIKNIEQTRLDLKKRRGIVHFIRYFPVYVARVEDQLMEADKYEIRTMVNDSYERIVQSMFDALKQIAKVDGDQSEDKGQLNYYAVLIENMHAFVTGISQSSFEAIVPFKRRAEGLYEENKGAYCKLALRRHFSKIMDYFDGVDRLLKSTAASEISKSSSYNRNALKRVVKEYSAKDIRKAIDALYKRVEKHFADSDGAEAPNIANTSSAMLDVWKACEEELLQMTDHFTKRISQCYKDAEIGLDYSTSDVKASFKRHL